MINFKYIINICGKLLYIECFFVIISALVSLYYGEDDFWAFVHTAGIILGVATAMITGIKYNDKTLTRKDGYFIVTFIWLLFTTFGSLPFILSGHIPNFADAFFETMSGFTTTGSTIINDIEVLPHATLFWRSLTQWLGGMGIITLFIALLPSLGIESRDLYIAEDTSPIHSKTGATFSFTTRSFWAIYIGLTFTCALLLKLGGMNWFDSITHSFTALSTGGFSTKNASIAFWDSAYIHYVLILFMMVAGLNFTLIFSLFSRHWKNIFKDSESRFCIAIIGCTTLISTAILYLHNAYDLEESFRASLFQIVSLMSTTGYVTEDYLLWPGAILPILAFVMFIGQCSGSTAGGLKCIRGLIIFKTIFSDMKRIIHPNAIILVKYNKKGIHPQVTNSIMNFFILYVLILTTGSVILYALLDTNADWTTAISATLTALSNVGPGFENVGPTSTFAWMNAPSKIFCAILMLIGRLEMFTVLVLFTREFWRR